MVEELEAIPDRPAWDEIKHPIVPGPKRSRSQIEKEWQDYERTKLPSVKGEDEHKVIKIASGSYFLIALKRNGEVWFRRTGEAYEGGAMWEYVSNSGPT